MWSSLELREVRVFLVLAEELHFAHAAERLLLTPSRVSQTIRALESRIGGRLFDRTSRRVTLTPLGTQLHREMHPAYEQMRAAYAAVCESVSGVAGVLRIGWYSPASGGPDFLEIVATFESWHRRCQVEVVDTAPVDPLTLLRRGDLDLAATRLPVSEPDLEVGPVLSEEARVVAVGWRHPFAGRDAVSYEEVADYPVSSVSWLPQELMDALIPPRAPSGRLLRRFAVTTPNEAFFSVAAGKLIHPTVRSFLSHHDRADVVAVPIRDLPPSRTALVTLANHESLAIEAFLRAASDVRARTGDA